MNVHNAFKKAVIAGYRYKYELIDEDDDEWWEKINECIAVNSIACIHSVETAPPLKRNASVVHRLSVQKFIVKVKLNNKWILR